MIVIYFYFLILFLVVFFIYLKPIYAILFFIFIYSLTQSYIDNRCNFYKNNQSIPIYTKEELYKELKHGDIVSNVYINHKYPYYLKYFNFFMAHLLLVIEENNEKYVIDTTNEYTNEKNIIIKKEVDNIVTNSKKIWYIKKTPLLEYLSNDIIKKQSIIIFRNPAIKLSLDSSNFDFTPTIDIPFFNLKTYYCTVLVGDILVKNKIISPSTKLFRHQTNDIIDQLQEKGYECFTLIYDNEANKSLQYDKKYHYKTPSYTSFLYFICIFLLLMIFFKNKLVIAYVFSIFFIIFFYLI